MKNLLSDKFLSVCLNPTMQKTLVLEDIKEDQVNRCTEQHTDASGKGINVTRVLHQLGAKVSHLTQLGGFSRDEFLRKTTEDDLDIHWVPSYSEIRFCYTLINRSNQTTTEIVEEGERVSVGTEEKIQDMFGDLLSKDVGTLILSGSKAKGFSKHIFPTMVKTAKELGIFVILDYRGDDLISSLKYGPDIIKPNLVEFMETFFKDNSLKYENSTDMEILIPEVKVKVKDLFESFGATTILTNGKSPTLFYDGKCFEMCKPEYVKAVNTIGCGDAFTAGLAYKLQQGETIKDSISFAHSCGAKNASLLRPGVIL